MSGSTKRKVTALLAVASCHGEIFFIDEEKALRVGQLKPDASECTLPLVSGMSKYSSALTRTAAVVVEMGEGSDTKKTHSGGTDPRKGKRIRTSVEGIPVYLHVERDESFARVILQPVHQEDGLCLIFAMLNCMDALAKRNALNHPYVHEPGRSFKEYFIKTENYDGRDGYTASDAIRFLQYLKNEGVIASWTLKALQDFKVTELLMGTRRMDSGDNMLVFGRTKNTVTEKLVSKSVKSAAKKAKKQGMSDTEAKMMKIDAYVKRGAAVVTKRNNPGHAVGVRFRTNIDGKPFAEIVDPAMKVSRHLGIEEYAGCMCEMYRSNDDKKLVSQYYVFRIQLPGETA